MYVCIYNILGICIYMSLYVSYVYVCMYSIVGIVCMYVCIYVFFIYFPEKYCGITRDPNQH